MRQSWIGKPLFGDATINSSLYDQFILSFLYHIKEHFELYQIYLQYGNNLLTDGDFQRLGIVTSNYQDSEFSAAETYHLAFYKAGFNSVIQQWVENGYLDQPEDIFGILQKY